MAQIVSRENTEYYRWGGVCDGWHLLKSDALSVIEERVPPGAGEERHYHNHSHQFFYVLSGEAVIEIDGQRVSVAAGHGVSVLPGMHHRLANESNSDIRFLVISSPKSHGDRVVVK